MVGFFAHESSSMGEKLFQTGKFVANVLGEEHSKIIASFLSQPQGPARFNEGSWRANEHQLPVLNDALASMEQDMVQIALADGNSSALVTLPDSQNFKYVVMPMRI